jgi:anti-sigma regulatory factor (Ser/Thr protein kinase)
LAVSEDIRIELRTDPALLHAVRALVWRYVNGFGASEEKTDEVVLAVDEACTNAFRHSCEGRSDDRIVLRLRQNAACLDIELEDDGIPAPQDRLQPRELGPPDLDDLRPGGLGIHLIRRVFDEVTFTPGEKQGNRVLMRLKRPEQ